MVPVALAAMAGGQIYSGMAADAEGKSAENMGKYNAALGEREAKAIEARTTVKQRLQAEEADRRMGTLRANLGASGAVTTVGSPLMIQSTQAIQDEYDNLMNGYAGREEATAARAGAALELMKGKIARKAGKNKKYASYIGAGSSLLLGFGMAFGGGGGGGGGGNVGSDASSNTGGEAGGGS
jgi:isopentenyl diphosphate isomerase/L-lactate dehydrogenase-like FMN-dependent dehydrogenase